jgi:uncharacterized protein (TIGR00290 family)
VKQKRTLLSWSSGKDSAWTLHVLRQAADVEVAGIVTTFNETADRVAMHAVRRELVEAQASRIGLPLWPVWLPSPCSNETYETEMRKLLDEARRQGVTHMAFGDLFLEDVRDYRVRLLAGTGVEPLFPIWGTPGDTPRLARQMLDAGLRAVLTCIDPKQCDARFVGRSFDAALLAELPPSVDPCGERGEFHTFCIDGPMFTSPVRVGTGSVVCRDGFWFADVVPEHALAWRPAHAPG